MDECAMMHIPVWSHAEGYGGALDSVKAGVHLIIHGQTLNDECLDIMAKKGIYFCPTIQLNYFEHLLCLFCSCSTFLSEKNSEKKEHL